MGKQSWKHLPSLIMKNPLWSVSNLTFISAPDIFPLPSDVLEHVIYMISRGACPRGTHHTLKLVQHGVHIAAWPRGN